MKKRILITVLFAVMAVSGLFAQAIPGGFTSPQSQSTQGRIRSAADDFIRPDSFSGVAFERWYSMASFASTNTATLGYAVKIGGEEEGGKPLFLSLFYSGRFWDGVQSFTSTESSQKVTTYTALPAFTTNPSNQVAVLIGVADMGFRLSFRTTYQSFDDNEFVAGTDYYKSHEIKSGLISPQLAWSMAKNLTDNGIKPWLTFDLGFNKDYTKTAQYSHSTGSWTAEERISRSQNNIAPELNIGLGSFIIANKNSWRTSADIEYRLQMTIYDNEYNYFDANGKNQIKSFNGTYNGTDLNERSFNGHRIRPSISTQWNGEKLRLRGRIDFHLILNSTTSTPMAIKHINNAPNTNGELAINGTTADAFMFSFNPDIQLAAQWQAASKLFLNVGGRINLQALSSTTTEGKRYTNGVEVDSTSYKTSVTLYGATQNQLNIGVTLNAMDNLSIEAVTGLAGTTKSTNSVNVFDTGENGLFNFGSILVAVKF